MTDLQVAEVQRLIPEIQSLVLEKLSIRLNRDAGDLFQKGILDSLKLVQLIQHLEKRFGVNLPMEELGTDSMHSVERIAELISSCRNGQAGEMSSMHPNATAALDGAKAAAQPSPLPGTAGEIQALFLGKLSISVDSASTDLLQAGILDSMSLIQVIMLLEEHFGLSLPLEDLDIDSFRSLGKLGELVDERKALRRISQESV